MPHLSSGQIIKRFLSFLFLTILGASFFGSYIAGVILALATASWTALFLTPLFVALSMPVFVPAYAVLLCLPIALVFWTSMKFLGHFLQYAQRVRMSGFLASVAAAPLVLASAIDRSIDGPADVGLLAPCIVGVSILIAPFTSWRAFRPTPSDMMPTVSEKTASCTA